MSVFLGIGLLLFIIMTALMVYGLAKTRVGNYLYDKIGTTKIAIWFGIINVVFSLFISYLICVNMIFFHYVSGDVAKRGIVFQETMMLSEYRQIGSVNYLIFTVDNYTRSDRGMNAEVIPVILNSNKDKIEK
jgi:hypothetical protein